MAPATRPGTMRRPMSGSAATWAWEDSCCTEQQKPVLHYFVRGAEPGCTIPAQVLSAFAMNIALMPTVRQRTSTNKSFLFLSFKKGILLLMLL
jgi:hypothetical protein